MPHRFSLYALLPLPLSLYLPALQTFVLIFYIPAGFHIKTNNISTHIKNKFPNAIFRPLL